LAAWKVRGRVARYSGELEFVADPYPDGTSSSTSNSHPQTMTREVIRQHI
jgi:hypothetical protein